jgi:hypothetical protein
MNKYHNQNINVNLDIPHPFLSRSLLQHLLLRGGGLSAPQLANTRTCLCSRSKRSRVTSVQPPLRAVAAIMRSAGSRGGLPGRNDATISRSGDMFAGVTPRASNSPANQRWGVMRSLSRSREAGVPRAESGHQQGRVGRHDETDASREAPPQPTPARGRGRSRSGPPAHRHF